MRKIKERGPKDLEDIVKDSIRHIGIRELSDERIALLLRLILSGMARYFFLEPDTEFTMGFLKFKKSPKKDELFTVEIIRSGKDGVINADTLWRYYKGELAKEQELKGVLNEFVSELLNYSQAQEVKIAQITSKIKK